MLASYVMVIIGGAFGSVARYATVLAAQNLLGLRFPYGTLIVNTAGSFIAGFLLTALVGRFHVGEFFRLFFFVGFLGGFTTFSSFALETFIFFQHGQWLKMIASILLNNVGSLSMVLIGSLLARYFVLPHT